MKVGVIGAGTMGAGIAQAFAVTDGYEVVLCDIKQEFADGGKARIQKALDKQVAKGRMEQAKVDEIMAKISTHGDNEAVADCDLVVEAAIERMDLKQDPLYEDTDFAMLDTHYYGGIKKYQWVTLPLALHGVIAKRTAPWSK